jgi:HD-like signal output (HDOD) protein
MNCPTVELPSEVKPLQQICVSPSSPTQHAQTVIVLSKLAPFHPAALRLLNISSESESALMDFEEVFKSDPALTADLLLVANSTEFGLRSRIDSIRHSLAYLGLERVRSLACTIAFSFYVRNLPRTEYMRSMWAHSIATAVIVESAGVSRSSHNLYTAGLTHDLGRLAILLSFGKLYSDNLSQEFADLEESNTCEKELFGLTHCEAGQLVAERWGFPARLGTYMAHHHEAVDEKPGDLMNLIRESCQLADSLGFPEVCRRDLHCTPKMAEVLRGRTGFDPDRLREQITKRIAAFG